MPRTQPAKESVLVLGGARSGKSAYALQRVQEWEGRLVYLATAEGKDEEMKKRIARHRARRRSRRWETIEEPLEVVWQLKEMDGGVGAVVLDCVTLWVSNALMSNQTEELENQVAELVEEIPLLPFHFLAVSNEVGLGLVPDTPLGREYRDLLGTVNQRLAQACKEVVFMTAGLPLKVKG
ncbi:MAG TPA: bifunctional adenosylcobinamide kinase/adenosylcobinamide-phosphate guanylyltransferase [Candidatus Binatia bacterium]|jgi:adenosylcobinamide kinase/adenosylcobinamide-phosphate guanylyltransferase|nr:bifunctional adenosylcobinamide kinase/adenosylcobinamide-phosphate guanylyltransferase [Candidatus Binatia bacterium]